ncbi:MAG: patatin-like phospholipase family protein [Gammaproteobacteria bacterium]|nr:patatin-like phospholipase family protein [Gammaproteobacteria bacterium]
MQTIDSLVQQTKAFLARADGDFESGYKLAEALIEHDEFGLARHLLDSLSRSKLEASERLRLCRRRALATYKDPHLNREFALDRAAGILDEAFTLGGDSDTETLGLAGAVHRRRWEVDGNRKHLSQAAKYYRAGYQLWHAALQRRDRDETLTAAEQENARDGYYPAINAAFLLDQLAALDRRQAELPGAAPSLWQDELALAARIREEIVQRLAPDYETARPLERRDYWPLMTLAEALFGLQRFGQTRDWLERARQVPDINDWEYLSAARQLVHLARIQTGKALQSSELEQTEAWKTLLGFLGQNAAALRTIFQGKMGLALSGGGFRASLYHIGVLAKLAERDLLRHVEVISCVSGGSIVGAHYYLELRRLFDIKAQAARDGDVSRDDYVRLVRRMAGDFLAGVQQNPRMQLLANPLPNFKMLWSGAYSRTTRLGELYEKLIYSRVEDDQQGEVRWINDCVVTPPERPDGFNPRRDNWKRTCKIPELILNATTLNSGHNWQFTATWMGESPVQFNPEIDSNARYRRLYYNEAPEAYRKVRLGTAVGASSCVPGLFEPIALEGLYPDTVVRLVDGGVYDNQGVAGLLEQDCNLLIVSDASGTLNTEGDPGGGVLKPLMRTNSTLMHRVRGAQYEDLKARRRSSLVRSFLFIHLKQGLDGRTVDWQECDDNGQPPPDANGSGYGVDPELQRLIAGMRTDLDSFTDLEAYALMASGYLATAQRLATLEGVVQNHTVPEGKAQPDWPFLKLIPGLTGQDRAQQLELRRQLKVSSGLFMKVWQLHPLLHAVKWGALALLGLALLWLWWRYPQAQPLQGVLAWVSGKLTLNTIMTLVGGFLLAYLATALLGAQRGARTLALLNHEDILRRLAVSLIASPVAALFAWIHLRLLDPLFQKQGRVE